MIETPNGNIEAIDFEKIPFSNPENLQQMLANCKNEFFDSNEEKIDVLRTKMNEIIN